MSFALELLAGQDEPVRRFFSHAIRLGAPLPERMLLSMSGRVGTGRRLRFVAVEELDGGGFEWRARAGWGRLRPIQVVDAYRGGRGSVEMRLFGRLPVSRSANLDTTRSAAGRAALESVMFAPATVLPGSGVEWRAEADDLLVATFDLPPERPDVEVRIEPTGAMRSVQALRWGDAGEEGLAYVPCGCEIHAESAFHDFVLPSRISAGWWFGTPRYEPFFEAEISAARPV